MLYQICPPESSYAIKEIFVNTSMHLVLFALVLVALTSAELVGKNGKLLKIPENQNCLTYEFPESKKHCAEHCVSLGCGCGHCEGKNICVCLECPKN
ncbi:hypothetical protein AB6A40_009428 [Gnathostoma spinigerum]|uniref:Uncharacterized protein n=1 Tax=Gnathostoma spinigerum TaxID=75299 RepID=A0ABD6EX32_9BILA